jgi:predicted CXXCH cytochrome family protein
LGSTDCDMCHEPHSQTAKFIKPAMASLGARICAWCHLGMDVTKNHAVGVLAAGSVPIDRVRDPNAGDFSGTMLYNPAGSSVDSPDGGYVHCLTCHSPHGASTSTLNSMSRAGSAICVNCHP